MSHVAMQFDDSRHQRATATLGVWIFLASETLFFGGLFAGYVVYRFQYPEAFSAGSGHLSVASGTAMTALLLTSSLTIVLADDAVRQGRPLKTFWLLLTTALLGTGFLAIKFHEYYEVYREHMFPGGDFDLSKFDHLAHGGGPVELFFCFYFFMTGLHAVHMIIGVVIVGIIAILTARGHYGTEYSTPVESTGLYWHFVDIVWVFLYPLLYMANTS